MLNDFLKIIQRPLRFSRAFLFLLIISCGVTVTRPKLEMTMAATAYMAARDAEAPNFAPNLFREAETFYLKAKSAYRKKFFNKAKEFAIISKRYSERAEYKAILKKNTQGKSDFE